jgi:hypothetical protein
MEPQNPTPLDRIDQYLLGQLPETARRQLESELAADEALQATLHFRKDLMAALKAEGRDALRRELQTLETGAQPPAGIVRPLRPLRIWYAVAAAAVVAVLVAVILYFPGQQQPEDLFASNFQPYPNVLVPLNRAEATADLPSQAFSLYEQGAYAQALPFLQQLATDAASTDYDFYAAMCQLQLGEIPAAIARLEPLSQSREARFRLHAQWYLALAYLSTGKTEATAALLSQMAATDDHPFAKQAQTLLREIPRPDNH